MSSNIYFNTRKKFSVRRSMVNVGSRLHHSIAPSHARKTARKLLLTPVRSIPKNTEPQGLLKGNLTTSEGRINTYQLGTGPVWIMCHGWSGSASQFYPLMQLIAQQGFTALAYDHPAHGQSEGEYSHLPGFINAFDELLDTQDNIAGVVAHSMGSASVLESSHDKIQHVPFLLIAPVLNYIDSLFEIVSKSGYSMKLFREIVAELEQQYQYSLDTIDPYQYLLSRKQHTVIVHDKRDRFACFSTSETAANSAEHIRLITTQGQGHGRVIHSEETMTAFKSLI